MSTERTGPPATGRRRVWLGLLAQLAVLVGLLALGVRLLDLEQVRTAFRDASPVRLAAFLALMMLTRWMTAWRWKIVARDKLGLESLTVGYLLRVGLLAEFANLWLQSFIGGEAVRIWKVVRRSGDRKLGTTSVVLDRFVGTVSLAVGCAPLLVALGVMAPSLADVDLSTGTWRTLALLGALVTLGAAIAVLTVPLLRSFVRRAFAFLGERRFLVWPFVVSLLAFPVLILAHRVGFEELAGASWWVVAILTLVPRLGRAVPLSLFGVTAVEGSVLILGAVLGVSEETLVLVVALNLLAKYLASGAGALAELATEGTRFFGEIRRADPASTRPVGEDDPS